MSSEHVEVLWAMLRKCVNERLARKSADREADALAAAIAALSAPKPGGEWVLVPREPSVGMWDSAEKAMIEAECAYNAGNQDTRSDAHSFPTMRIWQAVVGYRAMLASAPQPPAESHEDEVVCLECGQPTMHMGQVCYACLHPADDPAEAQAQGGGEAELRRMVARLAAHVRPTCGELWAEAERLLNRTAPPSAPVGVAEAWEIEPVEDDADTLVINTPDGKAWIAQRGDRVFELAQALALAQQPAAVEGGVSYPTPRNRQEAAALAGLALAYLGVTRAHIDAVIARCETDLAAQQGGRSDD